MANTHSAKGIFSERLRSARIAAGLSMDELVVKLDHTISKPAIGKYEKGIMFPDSKNLIKIAQALGVSPNNLLRPFHTEISEVDFRKKSTLKKKKENTLKVKLQDHLENYIELEEILGSKTFYTKTISKNSRAPEAAAYEIRSSWNLGMGPIANVLETLEDNGIKIIEIKEDESFDGLSGWAEEKIPFIVVNSAMDSFRKRFTALHELGHILLSFPKSTEQKKIEKACNLFAGAMLLPKESLIKEAGKIRNNFSVSELSFIKSEYGISIGAILFRLKSANIIDEARFIHFWKVMNSDPKLKKEEGLGRWGGEETSHRFRRLLDHALAENLISISKAAEISGESLQEVRKRIRIL
ncbi:XRE family transcriptional regulator [Leptospira wolffii]|uniref:XRE family transcriptional regulator n=1 Tax=Leptospira wolffii TaxID=409998 RepID=UPI000A030C4D|nr:XRE family transcriptional regulator [Leptospira wolffii]